MADRANDRIQVFDKRTAGTRDCQNPTRARGVCGFVGEFFVARDTLGPDTVLVPKPDEDGLDIAGIRPLEIRVPLGTNMPWNLRAPGRREGNLCGLSGSYIPFATTKAERLAAEDPRRSLEERYKDHHGYVKAVERATKKLMGEGFLLGEDAERFIREAEASDVLR